MSDAGGIKWGKIIMGAAVVTAATAACVYVGPELGTAINAVTEFIKNRLHETGTAIAGLGSGLDYTIGKIADFGTSKPIAAYTAAAVTGGAAMAAATSFVDRLNRSAEMVGIDTGRGR